MNRRAKVFLACVAGAGIGALVALEVASHLWWVGLLTGALVGYLLYDFKRAVKDIPVAGRKVAGQFDSAYWKDWSGAFCFGLAIASYYLLLGLLPYILDGQHNFYGLYLGLTMFVVPSLLTATLMPFLGARHRGAEQRKDSYQFALKYNVISVLFFRLPYSMLRMAKVAPRFLLEFFKLIH